jgi:hypothetical protein
MLPDRNSDVLMPDVSAVVRPLGPPGPLRSNSAHPVLRAGLHSLDAIAAARALLVVGDIDAACEAGHQAISVGIAVDSARVRRRFLDLAREAAPYESPPIRELRTQLLAADGTWST